MYIYNKMGQNEQTKDNNKYSKNNHMIFQTYQSNR